MTTTEESLHQRLRRLMTDQGMDPAAAAVAALDGMTKAQLVEMVLPQVEAAARSIERARVRAVEHEAIPLGRRPQTRPAAITTLVAEQFVLPDGRWVTWGDATVDDHLARAQWHRRLAASINATARRHELAVDLIRAAGASCLAEVDDWANQLELLSDAA